MGKNIYYNRDIEGFVLPEKKAENGLYEVTADRAHAWIEAYISNVGWIRFEPTPRYGEADGSKEREEGVQGADDFLDLQDAGQYREVQRRDRKDEIVLGDGSGNFAPKKKTICNGGFLIIGFTVILFLRILYSIFSNRKILYKEGHRKQIISSYDVILSMYSFLDHVSLKTCTPTQVLQDIRANIWEINIPEDMIETVNKAFYSNEAITKQDREKIERLQQEMEKSVGNRLGVFTYYYHKYLRADLYKRLQ